MLLVLGGILVGLLPLIGFGVFTILEHKKGTQLTSQSLNDSRLRIVQEQLGKVKSDEEQADISLQTARAQFEKDYADLLSKSKPPEQ